jgi:hypothetical protein
MEELIRSLQALMDAQLEHDNAFKKHDGYSWDYYGHNFIEDLKNAQERFSKALSDLIQCQVRNEVSIALSNMNLRVHKEELNDRDMPGFSSW